MRREIKILTAILLISSNMNAQYTIDWIKDCGVFNKINVTSVLDNQDNLIVTGYYQSENMYTRKYDIAGNLLWETIDSSGIQSMYEKPISIASDLNNDIYLVGKRYAIGSGWEYPDAVVAVKYNASGSPVWRQTVPISTLIGSQHPGFNLECITDNFGNLYIGTSAAVPSGFVFIKLNAAGNIVYTNNDTTNAPRGFTSMKIKGNMVVMTAGGTGPVIAWDTTGAVLWTTSLAGAGYDIEIDSINNIYILGSMTDQVSPTSAQDIVMYKLNSSGSQIWKKDYDFNGYDFPTRFTLVANKISTIGWGTNNSSGSPYFDWKTFQVDTSGTLLWSANFNGTIYNDEYPYNLVATPDGAVIVTGIGGPSPFPLQSLSYIQMVNVEYSNTGAQLWVDTPNVYGGTGLACHIASNNSLFVSSYYNMSAYHYNIVPTSLEDNFNTGNDIQIFPNPVASVTTLELELTDTKNISLTIINVVGETVKDIKLTGQLGKNTIPIDISELNSGIYFCKVQTNENARTIKLIKK